MDTAAAHSRITEAESAILDQAAVQVSGMMIKAELELLCRFAKKSPGTIVNLGAWAGLSTVALCLGAQTSSVEVVTVDSFAWSLIDASEMMENTTEDELREFLASLGMQPKNIDALFRLSPEEVQRNLAAFGFSARILKSLSWDAAELVADPVGLLFIDADHTRDSVQKDIDAWGPKLLPNGIVVFHDYEHSEWPDVKVVADEWAARNGWHQTESAFQAQAFQRTQTTTTTT